MRKASLVSVLPAVCMLALACATVESPGPPRVGAPAPEFAAPTLMGDTVSLASLRGDVVLLNLWATWCAPCRHETPFLQSIFEEHAEQGFRIVGVSMDTRDAADQVAMFVEEYGVTYDVLHDSRMVAMDLYQVLGLPATFLLDREGRLLWMRYGPIAKNDRDFEAALADALR